MDLKEDRNDRVSAQSPHKLNKDVFYLHESISVNKSYTVVLTDWLFAGGDGYHKLNLFPKSIHTIDRPIASSTPDEVRKFFAGEVVFKSTATAKDMVQEFLEEYNRAFPHEAGSSGSSGSSSTAYSKSANDDEKARARPFWLTGLIGAIAETPAILIAYPLMSMTSRSQVAQVMYI